MFSDQIPDPTKGATHYRTPDVSPDWSAGRTRVATIGDHLFYKIPLTVSNTAGTAVVSPSTVGQGGTAASAPVAPLASLGTSAAGPTRKAVNAAPGQTILAKRKIFLRSGGTCERALGGGWGGAIRSIAVIGSPHRLHSHWRWLLHGGEQGRPGQSAL